jgi:hypothetical protein
MNNKHHNLSTMAIIGFAVLSTLYVESKSRTPEERQKLYFISRTIITATLLTRFIIEDVISRRSTNNQPKEQPQATSAFRGAKERHSDSNSDSETSEGPAIN